MIKEENNTVATDEAEISAVIGTLSNTLKTRFIRTDCNAPDPVGLSGELPVKDHVIQIKDDFRKEINNVSIQNLYGGVFEKFDSNTLVTIARHRNFDPVIPTARDLLHVYGPDRDNIKDWTRYYRYAWKDKGPNAIIFSSDEQVIRQGRLNCNSYAYSGQSSFALIGAGLMFQPLFGNSRINIRPYVQWLTSASFTGTESSPASAVASLGIFIESWIPGKGEHIVEIDKWIQVWSQNTQGYITNNYAGGAASVGDGLSADILAITQRKYAIFVYVYLETSASPQQQKNELRFVTLDMDATVPFVVVQEKLE